ncbi:phosphoglycerate mutase-like protein AT74H [Salvia miltiorrhiza]|uniref:phosphoglycerate mutase-like protein AT74H n=1 Tax=Salvia miltiorrhiza TaxID=226208 RepID=UPI0025ACBE3E|nr:phosphoglycerate mutase-like protein AT74H [Salvia miltiorrhiza]
MSTTGNLNTFSDHHHRHRHLPRRIILVRHGESEVNEDEAVLEYVPNYKIKLIKKGIGQAQAAGREIKEIVSDNEGWKALFYVSPSSRTRETMEEIICRGGTFEKDRIVGVREECRLREQHFGNFQDVEERRKIKRSRNRYGKFFYRVPNGESSADVYDRVSTFLEGLWRDMESNKFSNEMNLIVVSHGLTILLFLMKWFNWTVDQFEGLTNPTNCEYRVLELGPDGEYSLALHHQLDQLKKWGLSNEMIEDQIIRARGLDHKCLVGPTDDSASDDSLGDYSDEKLMN